MDEYAEEPSCTIIRSALVVKVGGGEWGIAIIKDVLAMGCVGDLKLDIRQSFVDMSRDRDALIEGQSGFAGIEHELSRDRSVEGFRIGIRRHAVEIILHRLPDDISHGELDIADSAGHRFDALLRIALDEGVGDK